MAEGVGLADQAEELAAGGAHCVLHIYVGGRNGHVGGGESVECGISTGSIARPLCVQVCLGVLVEVFWGCEALLVDDVCGPETEGIFGQSLLAAAAVASDINDIHLIALIKVVGCPPLAVIGRVEPFCPGVDACRDKEHGVGLGGLFGGSQFLDIELVTPHLLARDPGVYIAAANVEGVTVVGGFLGAALWADGFDACAVECFLARLGWTTLGKSELQVDLC